MSDQPQGGRRGFGRRGGRGDRGGDGDGEGGRRRGGRRRRGEGKEGGKDEHGAWVPVTKLGRLVKEGKIKHLEEIYLHSIPVKEYQIIDHFFDQGKKLKDEVIKIMPVQKTNSCRTKNKI